MHCGYMRDRRDYHDELTSLNRDWLNGAAASGSNDNGTADAIKDGRAELRPDGDAELNRGASYDEFILPPCSRCANATSHDGEGHSYNEDDSHQGRRSFYKTDVVFFGDSVPKQRFDVSYAAVDAADGILCIGTSLTVHSAYRLVRRGIERGIPVAILNVGETRVENEGLGDDGLVTKLESPIGETLNRLVEILDQEKRNK
jgi:NAD-dependent deacetylase sirtuin 4